MKSRKVAEINGRNIILVDQEFELLPLNASRLKLEIPSSQSTAF